MLQEKKITVLCLSKISMSSNWFFDGCKLSNGLADNLLTCLARAWDFSKPCLVAPAMNTFMWDHPVTQPSLERLKQWGYIEIPCIEKVLMCNDKGKGAMAEPVTIVDFVVKSLPNKWTKYIHSDVARKNNHNSVSLLMISMSSNWFFDGCILDRE